MKKKRIAVIGGGASGAGLLWCITSQEQSSQNTQVTLFHDEAQIGGHSRTIPVWFDSQGKGHVGTSPKGEVTYPVDIGVQFVCSTLYPNLYRQLELPEFKDVSLKPHPELRMSTSFRDDLNWGNFSEYQQGSRFNRIYSDETKSLALRFEGDLRKAPFKKVNGKKVMSLTVGQYLDQAGFSRESDFFRYLLIPYLCVINGYGTIDLLETSIEDLFPIFAKIPFIQKAGPYASFTKAGLGWERFEHGATQWVQTMATFAVQRGATVRTASPVSRIYCRKGEWIVEWKDEAVSGRALSAKPGGQTHSEAFDEVVLTADMQVNRSLLAHDKNPYWEKHREFLAPERFGLIPGICYIHQDDSILSPSLRDQKEDGQFTGYFAWGQKDEGSDLYDLPYDLGASFQTYMMQNILNTPYPCYVSMYSEDRKANTPAPDKTIHLRSWRHGRWVASFFRKAKKELHHVQGLGGIWFAGNNTTVDSEEGALLSSMIVANRLAGFRYPFTKLSSAYFFYQRFRQLMFPSS